MLCRIKGPSANKLLRAVLLRRRAAWLLPFEHRPCLEVQLVMSLFMMFATTASLIGDRRFQPTSPTFGTQPPF